MIVYVKLIETPFPMFPDHWRIGGETMTESKFPVQEQAHSEEVTKKAHSAEQAMELKILHSLTLFDGARELGIEHHGALYRLKITRQGKLILNK